MADKKTKTTKTTAASEVDVQQLQNELQTLNENWKRALADYQNLVKRVEADKKEFVKFASNNLITKLLPTLDILALAAKHSQDQGVTMAVKQFQGVLAEEGLQEIVPNLGDKFDPALHECIEVVAGENPHTIVEIIAKGYKIDDYVIRPAKVKVAKAN